MMLAVLLVGFVLLVPVVSMKLDRPILSLSTTGAGWNMQLMKERLLYTTSRMIYGAIT